MNLYHVQDGDRPMYVVADSWEHALRMWRQQILRENDGGEDTEDDYEPDGIHLVARDTDPDSLPGILLPEGVR